MSEEEENYSDHVQINALMALVGKNSPRLRKSVPKSRWGLFWIKVTRGLSLKLKNLMEWIVLLTVRRKLVFRGRRRLVELAGIGKAAPLYLAGAEKIGQVDYPGSVYHHEFRRSAVIQHRSSNLPKPDVG